LARIEAHAHLDRNAFAAAHAFGIALDGLLHAQCRIASPHCVIFAGERRAEQRHDAVAHDLVDGAFVAMHRFHHLIEHRVEQLARLLGVAVGQQLHRSLEIGEQHGDLLALAFDRGLGREDLVGKMLRRVRLGSDVAPRRRCGLALSRMGAL
jgi:hypothetical protein